MSTVATSTPTKKIQNKLEMDLYRERIREEQLIYTVTVADLYYLRWIIDQVGPNSLFEADSFKKKRIRKAASGTDDLSLNEKDDGGRHDDPVQYLISSSIWGDEGITTVDGFQGENINSQS